MHKNYLLYAGRFIKEGLSYFLRLPRHLTVFGFGVSAVIFLFLAWQKVRRKEKLDAKMFIPLAALILYLVFVFMITTLARTPGIVRRHDLRFLHTLREILSGSRSAAKMTVINLLMLFPLGFLAPFAMEFRCSFRDVLFLAFLISSSIECTQYLFKLGLMETDDVVNNCLGALYGYILALLIKKIFRRRKNDKTGGSI